MISVTLKSEITGASHQTAVSVLATTERLLCTCNEHRTFLQAQIQRFTCGKPNVVVTNQWPDVHLDHNGCRISNAAVDPFSVAASITMILCINTDDANDVVNSASNNTDNVLRRHND